MEWESTGKGYSDFIHWCFNGDLEMFYEYFFWDTYADDLKSISGNEGVCFVPLLCMKEGKDINSISRKVVPLQDLWELYVG